MSAHHRPRNLKLTVAYDGTNFRGFQSQGDPAIPTVQSALEAAWERLVGEKVAVIGAGRTDAGVHALGQVVNFRSAVGSVPTERVAKAMNSALPRDVAVLDCVEVDQDFHARFDARWKRYEYRLLNRPSPSPVDRLYSLHVAAELDVEAMNAGAAALVGQHDFTAFSTKLPAGADGVRTVSSATCQREGDFVRIAVEGDGFLYHMVRRIAGSLLEVGLGKQDPAWIADVLRSKDPTQGGPTAPAHGLFLVLVGY